MEISPSSVVFPDLRFFTEVCILSMFSFLLTCYGSSSLSLSSVLKLIFVCSMHIQSVESWIVVRTMYFTPSCYHTWSCCRRWQLMCLFIPLNISLYPNNSFLINLLLFCHRSGIGKALKKIGRCHIGAIHAIGLSSLIPWTWSVLLVMEDLFRTWMICIVWHGCSYVWW